MSRINVRDWETMEDEMLDDIALSNQKAKIAAKNKVPKNRPHADKKDSFISMNKKGAASAAKRAASAAKKTPTSRRDFEEDDMATLRDEMGVGNRGRNNNGKRNYRR